VIGTQYTQPGGQDVAEFGFGPGMIPPLRHHPGDLVPGDQRVRVIGAQHAQLGGQDIGTACCSRCTLLLHQLPRHTA
jgi:hypothetical protein